MMLLSMAFREVNKGRKDGEYSPRILSISTASSTDRVSLPPSKLSMLVMRVSSPTNVFCLGSSCHFLGMQRCATYVIILIIFTSRNWTMTMTESVSYCTETCGGPRLVLYSYPPIGPKIWKRLPAKLSSSSRGSCPSLDQGLLQNHISLKDGSEKLSTRTYRHGWGKKGEEGYLSSFWRP